MWQIKDRTPYQVLEVHERATPEEVKAAHRALASKHHPDRTGLDSEEMAVINLAYSLLRDADARREYDVYYKPKCPRCGGTRSVRAMQGFKMVRKRCPDCA